MKPRLIVGAVLAAVALSGCTTSKPELKGNLGEELHPEAFYLPSAEASRVVGVATNGGCGQYSGADASGGGEGDRAEGDGLRLHFSRGRTQRLSRNVTNTTACGGIVQFTSLPLVLTGKSETKSRLSSSKGFPSNLSLVIIIPVA